MALRTGSVIGGYRLLRDFEGGANCRWTFAERAGAEFFVKEFHRPKYPSEALSGAIRDEKVRRCALFEARHTRLAAALRGVGDADGAVVAPADFFRSGLAYYHVAPKIERSARMPAHIATLSPAERLGLLRRLSSGLKALHERGITHGDLKPSNVLIPEAGTGLRPKLIDFDGAFFQADPPEPDEMSFDQNYMAPEVLTYCRLPTARADSLGTAADVFSACVLFFEYWTGSRPALGSGFLYAAEAVQAGAPVTVEAADIDPSLARLLRQGLSYDPRLRPTIRAIDEAIGAAFHSAGARLGRGADFPTMEASHSRASAAARASAQEATASFPLAPPRPGAFSPMIRKSKNLERGS